MWGSVFLVPAISLVSPTLLTTSHPRPGWVGWSCVLDWTNCMLRRYAGIRQYIPGTKSQVLCCEWGIIRKPPVIVMGNTTSLWIPNRCYFDGGEGRDSAVWGGAVGVREVGLGFTGVSGALGVLGRLVSIVGWWPGAVARRCFLPPCYDPFAREGGEGVLMLNDGFNSARAGAETEWRRDPADFEQPTTKGLGNLERAYRWLNQCRWLNSRTRKSYQCGVELMDR
ncbi:hypothetical protein Tco_0644110 [Tanacetum coccineum]